MATRHEVIAQVEEPEVEEKVQEEAQAADETLQPDDDADIAAGEDDALDTGPFPEGPADFTLLSSFRTTLRWLFGKEVFIYN